MDAGAPGLTRPHETVRPLVKALLCGDANFVPAAAARHPQGVPALGQPGHDRALVPLLESSNQSRTLYPGTNRRSGPRLSGWKTFRISTLRRSVGRVFG